MDFENLTNSFEINEKKITRLFLDWTIFQNQFVDNFSKLILFKINVLDIFNTNFLKRFLLDCHVLKFQLNQTFGGEDTSHTSLRGYIRNVSCM